MQKNDRTSRLIMLATSAVMVAVYVVLASLAIPIGGLKITFEHFPVVLCAVVYGPISGILVGGLGELINQLLTFGLTPTTILWILPIVFRGFAVGMCGKIFKKHMHPLAITKKPVPIVFAVVCVVSGILSTCLNTFALYVDSKMFGYYSFALVFGALAVRILLSIMTSIIICIAIKPLMHALRHAHFI